MQGLGSLGTLKLVFATDLFNQPSADGLFGYKMVLPTGSGLWMTSQSSRSRRRVSPRRP